MKKWEEFELNCTKYLNNKYGNYFTHLGFSNSISNDIEYNNKNKKFYIEVKMPLSQSGQFVLLPDYKNKKFIFSKKNKTTLNYTTSLIIKYMNKHFEKYIKSGTRGKDIVINKTIFNNWVINTYRKKGVKFFITKGKDYIIFPIEKYGKYFSVTAKYRIKKSGSSKVPISNQKEVIELLNTMNIHFELTDDFNVISNEKLDKLKFTLKDSEYMFSYFNNNIYRIRKLSNTKNANVIFSIKLIKEQDIIDLEYFVKTLI